jgi:RND family efflux transporter MFP subunit
MNDIRNRLHEPAIGRKTEKAPNDRPDTRRRWSRLLFGGGAFFLLAVGLAFGTSRSYSQQREVIATADHAREFVPSFRVVTVRASPGNIVITLPATTAAFVDANIYARATGYIGKRNVDIGDHVKQGELLAELGVPELDDEIAQNESTLEQLKAAVQQAQANSTLAQATWGRDKPLLRDGWVTGHQGDIDLQTVKADEAAVSVAQANVAAQERLLQVLHQNRAYASVVAPFDGTITQRNVDVGSLVQGNANTGTFMFEIMQKDVIRVRVYVPQDAAFGIAPGIEAIVRVPEIPGRTFRGKVTRIAEALQTGTRTLLTEIDISNPDGALQPGTYCTVELNILRKTPSFLVPADATIFNQNGMQVAVIKDGTAHIHKVSVTRDLGTQVEVDDGVEQGDLVIINPAIALSEGSKVRARAEPAVPRT